MSAPALSSEAQLRYILQWFTEFSELQREDFMPVFTAVRGEEQDRLAAALAFINCQDKPVSLFQCRIKLFNEWYPTWSDDERGRLLKGITEIDNDFGKKILEGNLTNGVKVNGDEVFTPDNSEINISPEDNQEKTEASNEPKQVEINNVVPNETPDTNERENDETDGAEENQNENDHVEPEMAP